MNDSQGDKELITVFQQMGAHIDIDVEKKTLFVRKGFPLSGIAVDINNFVDALTILAVVGCYAEGETLITNASVIRQKECNRICAVVTELQKMGADITETKDGLRVRKSRLKGTALHSYHDHRMVMSLAVAALGAEGETIISPVESVSKTFSTFVRDFNALGANIEEF
jgi:3-phosphoshikimate 1-carboxyvinyltransferase